MGKRLSKTDAALLIFICLLATLASLLSDLLPTGGDDDDEPENPTSSELRRNLQLQGGRRAKRRRRLPSPRALTNARDGALYPWARSNLRSVSDAPDPGNETALFWHIPKSGGSTVKRTYECLDLVLATRAGGRYSHRDDEEIVVFRLSPNRGRFVNVDTASYKGIRRGARLGLVPSGLADVIVTTYPDYAIERLYDENHRGRGLGLFRHPVHRLVSLFYYLQVADWEVNYSPEWKDMTLDHWAKHVNRDDNSYVRRLAGMKPRDRLTEEHLQMAAKTLKEKFVVGLTDEMEESLRRFNVFLGVDDVPPKCAGIRANSHSHPKLKEEDSAWRVIAERNSWDIRLWKHVVQLFREQKEIIDSHSNTFIEEE